MASTRLNDLFIAEILSSYPLDDAIEFISKNLDPDDVFDDSDLEAWAKDNGYTQ